MVRDHRDAHARLLLADGGDRSGRQRNLWLTEGPCAAEHCATGRGCRLQASVSSGRRGARLSRLVVAGRRTRMSKRLAEKSVLITGASSGIGRAIARRFAAEDAKL